MSATIALAPFSPNLGLLLADAGLCGFGGGGEHWMGVLLFQFWLRTWFCSGIDTAQVVWIIEMWAEESSSYLAGYQFFFALGTFISPLIVRPFLAEKIESNNNQNNSSHISTNSPYLKESHIEIPFGIVSAMLFISGLTLLALHFWHRYEPPTEQNERFVCKRPTKRKLIYISLGLLTLAPYVGIEITNFQMIDTFAQYSHLQLSSADSALVHSLLAGAFALCRGIIFVITFMYWSEKSIYLSLITIFVGNTILLVYQMLGYSKGYLWTGAIICGSGFSSMFPSIYAFLENQFTISNTIGGLFVCVSGLVGAVLPTLSGQFIEEQPLTLVYVNYICATIIGISFISLNIIIYSKSESINIANCISQDIDSKLNSWYFAHKKA